MKVFINRTVVERFEPKSVFQKLRSPKDQNNNKCNRNDVTTDISKRMGLHNETNQEVVKQGLEENIQPRFAKQGLEENIQPKFVPLSAAILERTAKETENWVEKDSSEEDEICVDSGLDSAASSWGKSVAEVKEHAFAKLEEELQNAKKQLKLKDDEVARLCQIRQDLESELQDLTASLFQEAHTMVREANMRQLAAEKSLKESAMKVDMLTAEVSALKTLVLTSTPSKPNLHLRHQSPCRTEKQNHCQCTSPTGAVQKHQRSPSHFEFSYYRESAGESNAHNVENNTTLSACVTEPVEVKDGFEVDPNVHMEFVLWKENPVFDEDNPFIIRIYKEDIDLCLNFNNRLLSEEVKNAVVDEEIFVEAVDKSKAQFPKKCALMEVPRLCMYRMKIGKSETWYPISQICRNRIIAVCNFLNYLRYIKRGLVKSSTQEMYWEMIRLRKGMTCARLGLPTSTEQL